MRIMRRRTVGAMLVNGALVAGSVLSSLGQGAATDVSPQHAPRGDGARLSEIDSGVDVGSVEPRHLPMNAEALVGPVDDSFDVDLGV
ncbi:hypothetical protein Bcav_3244 [Beutenbergia cavernae DSM 12333]|uniref:Secreted protein n=1 Tax=Beutenbergia cavernae (strain ATCC BAA-8 / DSM 12333 / CCUG 43141 / JCM 11478 / NBRC 16432 / NCIMB 13614 / HKI 0122) TaxID=471853 RepID=C5C178_BEUC1|nr:hypothetical protein [Beutenbergia cavernae]ACQ81488.1 hypothetical protein Bcav_3244 [Beutenbergia cavernae DSM 12333]